MTALIEGFFSPASTGVLLTVFALAALAGVGLVGAPQLSSPARRG
jgi:hypothetical protein